MVKTLIKIIAIGIDSIAIEERARSTLNTARAGGDIDIASQQDKGVGGWQITKRRHQV